jgi:hypothetical protein
MVTREEKEDALQDKHFNDKYFVWKSIVSEGVKDSDLSDYMADQESLELPIILDKVSRLFFLRKNSHIMYSDLL